MSIYAIVTRWGHRAFAATMQPFVVVSSLIGAAAVLGTSPGAFPELSAPMWCGIALAIAAGLGVGQFVNRFVSPKVGRVVVIALGLIGAVIAIAAGVSAL